MFSCFDNNILHDLCLRLAALTVKKNNMFSCFDNNILHDLCVSLRLQLSKIIIMCLTIKNNNVFSRFDNNILHDLCVSRLCLPSKIILCSFAWTKWCQNGDANWSMGGVPPENYSKAKMVKCSDFVMCFYSYDVVSRNRRAKL